MAARPKTAFARRYFTIDDNGFITMSKNDQDLLTIKWSINVQTGYLIIPMDPYVPWKCGMIEGVFRTFEKTELLDPQGWRSSWNYTRSIHGFGHTIMVMIWRRCLIQPWNVYTLDDKLVVHSTCIDNMYIYIHRYMLY